MPDTVAILLAAGESSRMGRPKALLPWQGTNLLAHQISVLLQGGADRVVVVVGHQSDELKPIMRDWAGVSWTLNADYAEGKTTSIKAGLDALGPNKLDAILILNVDQPRSAGTIQYLLQQHRESGQKITIPTYQGKGGHPIIMDPVLLSDLRSITEETLGVKAVVRDHADSTLQIEAGTAEVLWDLNTPEQYQKALESKG